MNMNQDDVNTCQDDCPVGAYNDVVDEACWNNCVKSWCKTRCNALGRDCDAFVWRDSDQNCAFWKKGPLNIRGAEGHTCYSKQDIDACHPTTPPPSTTSDRRRISHRRRGGGNGVGVGTNGYPGFGYGTHGYR